ncbi:hypothetical protein SAMN05519104_5174 [Rhizobiales bacterium GAS188]|nr:hypothetical protein SAMN05519104_5174 [Rhizobiales bacterium GAS188]
MSFGNFGYWHLVLGAPSGTVKERATFLLALWREKRVAELVPDNPSKAEDILKAMILELGVASLDLTLKEGGFPTQVVSLIDEVLPQWAGALFDPPEVYSGNRAGRGRRSSYGHQNLRAIAVQLDCEHIASTGKVMKATELERKLKGMMDEFPELKKGVTEGWGRAEDGARPNLAKTIRDWRSQQTYRDDLEYEAVAREMHLNPDIGLS